VRNNTLCVIAVDFDAKSRKIWHVALPVDADNKRYVQQSMQILKNWQNEIKKKMIKLQNNMQIMLNELKKMTQQVTIHRIE